MTTAQFYLQNWLRDKPPGLANYLNYNRHRKKEICYIFRLRAEADGSYMQHFIKDIKLAQIYATFVT